jgi:hypothetical protein
VLEGQWEYRNKVAALATWAAGHWELPAAQVVVHGGSWGSEDADRQLSKSMELGRLWGAGQRRTKVYIRLRVAGGAPTDELEMVMGYANAPLHRRKAQAGERWEEHS